MKVTFFELVASLSVAVLLIGTLWILLRRERARCRRLDRQMHELCCERGQELIELRSSLQEGWKRESRLIRIISSLWNVLARQHETVRELKGRYMQEKSERAREAVWLTERAWEIGELEGLITRVLARWAAEKRARAREALAKDLLGAIVHTFGKFG